MNLSGTDFHKPANRMNLFMLKSPFLLLIQLLIMENTHCFQRCGIFCLMEEIVIIWIFVRWAFSFHSINPRSYSLIYRSWFSLSWSSFWPNLYFRRSSVRSCFYFYWPSFETLQSKEETWRSFYRIFWFGVSVDVNNTRTIRLEKY